MNAWNIVITVHREGFAPVTHALRDLAPIGLTSYHNLLTMTAKDPMEVLAAIETRAAADMALREALSRVAPAMESFFFFSPEDFEAKASMALLARLQQLAGKSFHVRLHRRGHRQEMVDPAVESRLGEVVQNALKAAGTPGVISFSDPDVIVAIDTVDDQAGIALWTREDIARHPLLRPG